MTKKILLINALIFLLVGCGNQVKSQATSQSLTSSELKSMIDSKSDYILVDVRSESEFGNGHIPTAINIPHTAIKDNLDKLPKDKKVILYCASGRRSGIASKELLEAGYTKLYDFGSVKSWEYDLVK